MEALNDITGVIRLLKIEDVRDGIGPWVSGYQNMLRCVRSPPWPGGVSEVGGGDHGIEHIECQNLVGAGLIVTNIDNNRSSGPRRSAWLINWQWLSWGNFLRYVRQLRSDIRLCHLTF